MVAKLVRWKWACKKTILIIKKNYFNLLGSLFRYESTAFHSAVMLPAPNPVAPHRCMTSRKNVSLLNKGFVNTCIRYLSQRQGKCVSFFQQLFVIDANNVVILLTIAGTYTCTCSIDSVCHLDVPNKNHSTVMDTEDSIWWTAKMRHLLSDLNSYKGIRWSQNSLREDGMKLVHYSKHLKAG